MRSLIRILLLAVAACGAPACDGGGSDSMAGEDGGGAVDLGCPPPHPATEEWQCVRALRCVCCDGRWTEAASIDGGACSSG